MDKNIEKNELTRPPAPLAADHGLPESLVPSCTPEEYDKWFRAKVQEALDDPRPALPFDEAMTQLDAMLESKRRARSES